MNPLSLASWAIRQKRKIHIERLAFDLWRRSGLKQWARRGILKAKPLFNLPSVEAAVEGRKGIEIGGPSPVFSPGDVVPIYAKVGHLDVCNFGPETMWEGKLHDGAEFTFLKGRPAGRQLLREATDLKGVAGDAYDFVLSSHCLEHVANPLKALEEWRRIIRPGGHLLLIVPHPHHTFDHRRPVTPFEHLLEDFDAGVGEDDLTHLEEILTLHDFARDPWAKSPAHFEKRSRDNVNNRGMHHHVFTPQLVKQCMQWAGLTTAFVEDIGNLHIVALGSKA